jgi:hypothetical protein
MASSSKMQIEVQKRARSACTTFKALKSEWDEVRGEAQDAMTVFANANLELHTVDNLSLPETLSEVDVREALRAKRKVTFKAAAERLAERREDVEDIRRDFEKLANVEKYFASSIVSYPDDGALFRTMTFVRFRRAFAAVAQTFVDDIVAKEKIMDTLSATKDDRSTALVLISAFALDPLIEQDLLDEFESLVLKNELGG